MVYFFKAGVDFETRQACETYTLRKGVLHSGKNEHDGEGSSKVQGDINEEDGGGNGSHHVPASG